MVEEERKGFLITDVKSCTEGFNPKWSNTLVYEVQTEQGDRLFLEMTIDVVKKFRNAGAATAVARKTWNMGITSPPPQRIGQQFRIKVTVAENT